MNVQSKTIILRSNLLRLVHSLKPHIFLKNCVPLTTIPQSLIGIIGNDIDPRIKELNLYGDTSIFGEYWRRQLPSRLTSRRSCISWTVMSTKEQCAPRSFSLWWHRALKCSLVDSGGDFKVPEPFGGCYSQREHNQLFFRSRLRPSASERRFTWFLCC